MANKLNCHAEAAGSHSITAKVKTLSILSKPEDVCGSISLPTPCNANFPFSMNPFFVVKAFGVQPLRSIPSPLCQVALAVFITLSWIDLSPSDDGSDHFISVAQCCSTSGCRGGDGPIASSVTVSRITFTLSQTAGSIKFTSVHLCCWPFGVGCQNFPVEHADVLPPSVP